MGIAHFLNSFAAWANIGPAVALLARLGAPAGAALLVLLAALLPKRREGVRRAAIYALVAGVVAFLLAHSLEGAFVRPRPSLAYPALIQPLVPVPAGSPFPSRSASVIFALAAGLTYASDDLAAVYALFGLLVAIGEVAAGIAYPTDEVAGALLGAASAWGVLIGRDLLEGLVHLLLRGPQQGVVRRRHNRR